MEDKKGNRDRTYSQSTFNFEETTQSGKEKERGRGERVGCITCELNTLYIVTSQHFFPRKSYVTRPNLYIGMSFFQLELKSECDMCFYLRPTWHLDWHFLIFTIFVSSMEILKTNPFLKILTCVFRMFGNIPD